MSTGNRLSTGNLLADLDYSVVQQCMHCGMCLPTCPTYAVTLRERSSPRGRIAMMRAIADGELEVTRTFAEEMYFCLGCLACQTACPAGVDYATLFERARAEVERVGVLDRAARRFVRWLTLGVIFTSHRRLHLLGRVLLIYQRAGLQTLVRRLGLLRLLPRSLRELEPLTPVVDRHSTRARFRREGRRGNPDAPRYRVGLLAGCVQDLAFADVNLDTVQVLQANGCHVELPEAQQCCGSLHAHNGDVTGARRLAKANIDAFDLEGLDAVIVNAGGCGSHMRQYGTPPGRGFRIRGTGAKLGWHHSRYSRVSSGDRLPAAAGWLFPQSCLPRILPPGPRPERENPAAASARGHSRSGTGRSAGIRLVLRQCRHL